jgi:hypothetical protein
MLRYFTRDIFWLMTLVAVTTGWLVDHARQREKIRRVENASIEAAAEVQVEWLRRYRGEAR